MVKIGLLSDTHAYWDERYLKYFKDCDEIWHVGDIGSLEVADKLENFKPVRMVVGNADGAALRERYPKILRFRIEQVEVLMTHIGGYPGNYAKEIAPYIFKNPPSLFISGHSHILKVLYDKTLKCLHINPGAAGKQGFHKTRTLVRFVIDKEQIKDLEVIELAEK
ncbi:MAG: metallophosphoesterase family protein [Bacteroidales bacterium]|nr:metallophosphoesterase family protein [Bacteroidales bacterium]